MIFQTKISDPNQSFKFRGHSCGFLEWTKSRNSCENHLQICSDLGNFKGRLWGFTWSTPAYKICWLQKPFVPQHGSYNHPCLQNLLVHFFTSTRQIISNGQGCLLVTLLPCVIATLNPIRGLFWHQGTKEPHGSGILGEKVNFNLSHWPSVELYTSVGPPDCKNFSKLISTLRPHGWERLLYFALPQQKQARISSCGSFEMGAIINVSLRVCAWDLDLEKYGEVNVLA